MSLSRDMELLRRVALLADFSDDQLRLLAFSAESISYRDGEVLFVEGERADGGFIVASGAVEMSFGEPPKSAGSYGPGSLIGETALLVEARRPARAVAVGQTDIIRVRRALFKRMLQEFPEIAVRLFQTHASRFQTTTSALGRVANVLEQISSDVQEIRSSRQGRD